MERQTVTFLAGPHGFITLAGSFKPVTRPRRPDPSGIAEAVAEMSGMPASRALPGPE